jgi:hypothetical protein
VPHRLFAAPIVLAALALGLAAGPVAARGPVAQAAKACHVDKTSHKYGTTYLFSLRVSHTSCAAGVSVVESFNACRHAHGKAGRCVRRTQGYACAESRYAVIGTEYDSNATCRKGKRVVKFHYEQFT